MGKILVLFVSFHFVLGLIQYTRFKGNFKAVRLLLSKVACYQTGFAIRASHKACLNFQSRWILVLMQHQKSWWEQEWTTHGATPLRVPPPTAEGFTNKKLYVRASPPLLVGYEEAPCFSWKQQWVKPDKPLMSKQSSLFVKNSSKISIKSKICILST